MGSGNVRQSMQVVPLPEPLEGCSLDLEQIIRSRAREFHLPEGKVGSLDGECGCYLERAAEVPPITDSENASTDTGPSSPKSIGSPSPERRTMRSTSVRAWVEDESGKALGRTADWPTKRCGGDPAWFSAQSLGSIAGSGGPPARLRIEVRDQQQTVLGSLTADWQELLPGHRQVVRALDGRSSQNIRGFKERASMGAAPLSVTFQLFDASAFTRPRTVYFVRHAQSIWNQAQSKKSPKGALDMVRTTDHPLSPAGRQQAEELSAKLHKLEQAGGAGNAASSILQSSVVFVSPLTRAVQTALLALGPLLHRTGKGEVLLMANAREKQTLRGRDTWCTKVGKDIVANAMQELRYHSANQTEGSEALKAFPHLYFDVAEVQDPWWSQSRSESPEQLQVRLQEFMRQIFFSPLEAMVIVGHSNFLCELLRKFVSPQLRSERSSFVEDLCSKKLMNCGVIRLHVDPSIGLDGGPITEVELVLDSTLEGKVSGKQPPE